MRMTWYMPPTPKRMTLAPQRAPGMKMPGRFVCTGRHHAKVIYLFNYRAPQT